MAREKPCVFTAIRDPISHFLSGYNEVEAPLILKTPDAIQLLNVTTEENELASPTRIFRTTSQGIIKLLLLLLLIPKH